MPSRSWKFRIDDIIEAIDKIGRYTNGIDFEIVWKTVKEDLPVLKELLLK